MPSLVAMAEELLVYAKQVEQSLEAQKIPHTSFDADTLQLLSLETQTSRYKLLDLSHDFRQLVRGAKFAGLDIAYNWTDQIVLRIVWQFKLASAIPVNASATYDEIASRSGLGKSMVTRTIRAAIPLNIFDEPTPGCISHTAISRLLAEDELYYQAIGLQLMDLGPASSKLIEVWEKSGDSMGEPDECAFSLYNGGRSLFSILAEEPARAHRFDSAMKHTIGDQDPDFNALLTAFDWASLDKPGARLIDVGGSHGRVSQAIARHTKHLSFTVQDLPRVAKQGAELLPLEFKGRTEFQPHDFEEPQLFENPPDAYLISRCLHNWSDHHAANILRALVPGLKIGAHVLIWDAVIESEPVRKLSKRFNLQEDFIMATIFNGKDRTAEEFAQLLGLADPRFKMVKVHRSHISSLSMVEARFDA